MKLVPTVLAATLVACAFGSTAHAASHFDADLLGHYPVGAQPTTVWLSPDGTRLMVASRGDSTVAVFDSESMATSRTYPIEAVGHGVWSAMEDPIHGDVLISNWMGENLRLFDLEGKVTAEILTGIKPSYIAFSPDNKRAYVAGNLSANVTIVDLETRKAVRTIKVGQKPMGVAVSPDGRWLYVASCASNMISKVDLKHEVVLENFGAPLAQTTNLAITPDGANLLAAGDHDELLVIDTERGDVRKVTVGRGPAAVALTPDGLTACVANYDDASISIVDLSTLTAYKKLGAGPGCIHVATDGKRLYSANDLASTVTVYQLKQPKPADIPCAVPTMTHAAGQ